MSYNDFYDRINRDEVYSSNKQTKDHPHYPIIKSVIDKYGLESGKALEIGSGNGRFQDIVEDYTGIDVSENLKKFYHKPYIKIDDSVDYPFENDTFDFVFTKTVFEHIPNIDHALEEMIRVTKKGGIIFFMPAWNCRQWICDGLHVRPYSELVLWDKIKKFFIPVRNSVAFRASYIIPLRFICSILFAVNKNFFGKKLRFKKLNANYEVFYGSDSDACNCIEPYLSMLYFKARGLEILNYKGYMKEILFRNGAMVLKK